MNQRKRFQERSTLVERVIASTATQQLPVLYLEARQCKPSSAVSLRLLLQCALFCAA